LTSFIPSKNIPSIVPVWAPRSYLPRVPPAGVLNILGLPVTQCPLGLSQEGLPMGLQVGAGKLQDRLTLEVALYLEKAFGGWRDPGAD